MHRGKVFASFIRRVSWLELILILILCSIFIHQVYSKSLNMSHKVFVYGTLKKNEPNHYWLTNPDNGVSKFICEGTTKEKYPLIIATKYNIPFLLYSPGKGYNVKGEIYEVDDKMLGNLDILEDHPNFYIREQNYILVPTNNETIKCWVYFLKTFKNELLRFTYLENYSSNGSHGLPYLESNENSSTIDDLDDVTKRY